jgi:predicted DNA-binding protein (UPF0251 family)
VIFKPAEIPLHRLERARLDHDEMEAMYLCDFEGMTQEVAGQHMGISRGTVQRLLVSARKKLVRALAVGQAISIETGVGNED